MKRHSRLVVWSASLVAALAILNGCQTAATETNTSNTAETGQQIGDSMATIDSGTNGGGGRADLEGARRLFERLSPSEIASLDGEASRAVCHPVTGGITVSACTAGVVTATFNNCTLGGGTFAGTNTFTFSDTAGCDVDTAAETVTRVPDFTVTGRHGGTFTVTKTGTVGQQFTRGAGATGTFSNDGIRRVFAKNGTTLFDFTTTTTVDLAVSHTGSFGRAGRTISAGTLRVTNNLASPSVSCDFTPTTPLVWGSGCNCPTSGAMTAACSDGKTASITFSSTCGSATVVNDTTTETVTLDRCFAF